MSLYTAESMSSIVGLGTDIVSVPRFEAAIARHGERLLARVFTPGEIRYASAKKRPAESFAARFAAKEACFKAVGAGWPKRGITYHDVEVVRVAGPPRLELTGSVQALALARGATSFLLTLSHTDEMALAVVMLQSGAAL